jgi:hypothetical protein
MRRRRVLVMLAAVLWAAGPVATPGVAGAWAVPAARAAVRAASSWGRAIKVPGLAALNKGGAAAVSQVSCGSAGNCAAGGSYQDRLDHTEGFVASEKHGVWGRAIKVPGLRTLNKGGNAGVASVSCSPRRNCAAGGFYVNRNHFPHLRGFVVSERNGVWGRAIRVPGLAALGPGAVGSVSCASAGNCAAGGYYLAGRPHGFVVSERNGVWGQAIEVPGLAALSQARPASVNQVSCGSAGSCAAGGFYRNRPSHQLGFVAVEANGVWGQAIKEPGPAALAKGGQAAVSTVSCASAGSCAAGGGYDDTAGHLQGFVAVEANGVWGQAIAVPGLAALNKGGSARVFQVSCPSAGNCAAGGSYLDGTGHQQGFVISETNGVWGQAIKVPGLGTLNNGRFAQVISVSCASPGNCAAGGSYRDQQLRTQGFLAREKNGVWGRAVEVRGLGALNKAGDAQVSSVSCAPGRCAAGGYYADRARPRRFQGFVTS